MSSRDNKSGAIIPASHLDLITGPIYVVSVSYTHLRAHETVLDLVCRLLLDKKNCQLSVSFK